MTKLNKKSKHTTASATLLPPTHQVFKLEVNHSCSIDITREQYNEFLDKELAVKHKDKLVKNLDNRTYHEAFIIRIVKTLYNRIKVYRSYGGIVLELLEQYRTQFLFHWHYRSSSAILMAKAPCN